MSEAQEPFRARVLRLGNYLIRAFRYNKASILFALYLSEFLRVEVEKELQGFLKENGLDTVNVDAGSNKDLPSFFSSTDSRNTVFLVKNLEKGFPEVIQFLNFKREGLIEHQVRVVFWVTEEELAKISTEAPDFFAFRNRVVEFMELPLVEEHRPALIKFAGETEYRSLDEIKHSIELKEKLLSELSGETEISGYLLNSLGILYNYTGSYKKAIKYHEKALSIDREIGDRRGEGADLGNLGNAYRNLGQVEKAIEYYKKAFYIAQEIGDRRGEGVWIGSLGLAYYNLGQVEKAIEYHEKALSIDREIGDRRGEGADLGNLGNAYSDIGQIEKAIEYNEKALSIAQEIGDRRNEEAWLGNLGNAFSNLGQVEKAIEYYKKALSIAQEIGDRKGEGASLGNLGIAYYNLGQVEKAIEYYKKALSIAQEIGDRRGEGNHLNNLGSAYLNEKKYKEALACYLLAREIHIQIKDPNIKITESNINRLKNDIGEAEFKDLMKEVEPVAKEIVKEIMQL